MALIIPPGFLQAVYVHSVTGDPEPMVTTCGHQIGGSGASGNLAADDLMAAWLSFIIESVSSSDCRIEEVVVYVGQDGGPPLVFESTLEGGSGNQGASTLPPNCATLVRKRTSAAGRRGRGRFYLPGCPDSGVDENGNVDPGFVTQVDGAFATWLDFLTEGIGGGQYPPVILHRSEGIGVEPAPTTITAFTCDAMIATQRRRLRR